MTRTTYRRAASAGAVTLDRTWPTIMKDQEADGRARRFWNARSEPRFTAGLSQEALAERAGISAQGIKAVGTWISPHAATWNARAPVRRAGAKRRATAGARSGSGAVGAAAQRRQSLCHRRPVARHAYREYSAFVGQLRWPRTGARCDRNAGTRTSPADAHGQRRSRQDPDRVAGRDRARAIRVPHGSSDSHRSAILR